MGRAQMLKPAKFGTKTGYTFFSSRCRAKSDRDKGLIQRSTLSYFQGDECGVRRQ